MKEIRKGREASIGENPKWDLATGDVKLKAEEVATSSGKDMLRTCINYELQPLTLQVLNIGLPEHWKLDLHQSLAAEGADKYTYTDGEGFSHTFIKYPGEGNRYYDTEGAGLTLDSSAETITDESGNRLKFENGRLKQITEANTAVVKNITYDAGGLIKRVTRGNSAIEYNYSDGILQTITCKTNGNTIRQLKLCYAGGQLAEIRLSAGGTEELLKSMTYDEAGCLSVIADAQSSDAIEIVNEHSNGQNRAVELGQGYIWNASYKSLYRSAIVSERSSDAEPQKVTEVCIVNENGIKMTYMLSEDGVIIDRLEGDIATGYKTLDKRYGTALEYSGATAAGAGTINGRPVAKVIGSIQPVIPEEELEKLNESTYQSLDFYLRHSESGKRVFAKLTVNGNSTERAEADGRARDVWQQVRIPFLRPTSGITTIKLELTDNTGAALTADVCDLRLTESAYSELKVTTSGINFNDITTFRCITATGATNDYDNGTEPDWYMTAGDYMRTLRNQKRSNGAEFDAYFGNGTLRRKVSDITIYDLQTQGNISLLSGVPVNKVTSADGNSVTETTYTYTSDGCTAESQVEIEYTNADRKPATRQFTISESYDYAGRLISRTAENGMVTNYSYFADGQLQKVTLKPQSGAEVTVCEYSEDGLGRLGEVHAGSTGEIYTYNSSDGSIDKISKQSYNKSTNSYVVTGITQEYEYDGYGNVTEIGYSNGGKHDLTYEGLTLRGVTDGQVQYMYSRDLRRNARAFNVYDETLFYDSDYSGTGEVMLYEETQEKVNAQTNIIYRYGETDSYIYNRTYDGYDRAKSVTRGGKVTESYEYESGEESGYAQRVTKITDTDSGVNYEFEYSDEELSKITRAGFTAEYSGGLATYKLDGKGALTRAESAPCGRTEKVSYYEEYDGTHIIAADRYGCECAYNEYGQLHKRTMADESGGELHNYSYSYAVNGTGVPVPTEARYRRYLTPQLIDITETVGYDNRGNINSVNRTFLINNVSQNYAGDIKSYEYDASNRISREKVSYNGRDYIYEYLYDTNGRLKCKKDIRRNGSVTENEDEYNYTYDRFGRMTKCAKTINGKGYTDIYTYNAAGNRTYQSEYIVQENKYRQKQYFWTRGKLLGQYLEGSTITTYKYDYADRLVKRTTGNSTMEYYYDGDRLVAQTSSDGSSIYYFYDDAGVCGAEYNNEYYEFVRNIFGDIVVVLKGGEIAGRYEYDPYGVCTEYTQNNFVKLNPFRYRGYFYDDVSGMYVLKTRYYDPVTAQFLSPDHPDYLDPETLGGIDLYAYCLNNPVMGYDPEGTFDWDKLWGWIAASAIIVAGIALIVTPAVLSSALIIASNGLAATAMVGAGVGVIAGVSGSIAVQGGLSNIANIDPWSVFKSGAIGGVIGTISGVASYGVSLIGRSVGSVIGNLLANTRHLNSGKLISEAFGLTVSSLMTAGQVLGGAIGGSMAGMAANYTANVFVEKIYGVEYIVDNPNYVRSGILKLFKWLF